MEWIDRAFYLLKGTFPACYAVARRVGRVYTVRRYRRAIDRANRIAWIEGTIQGRAAIMRALLQGDLDALATFFREMPEVSLRFFRPHGFDRESLAEVIDCRDVMSYGLFTDGELRAYAILKLFPTRKAYLGLLVSPEMSGMGIGKFLIRFLYWQAFQLGFQPCSTIHRDNIASLRCHVAVRPVTVAGDLPNGFNIFKPRLLTEDGTAPLLRIAAAPPCTSK